jgi:hypothetical protein
MREVEGSPGTFISDIDADGVEMLDLEGLLGFHCDLLEDPNLPDPAPGQCRVRARDLLPVVTDRRSGIKVATRDGRILAYAIFGQPRLFRNIGDLDLEVEQQALLIAALYATPEAREDNIDVDLLIAVMDFARERDYSTVQALCRAETPTDAEARPEMLRAAGFALSEAVKGLCLAETTIERWDAGDGEQEP